MNFTAMVALMLAPVVGAPASSAAASPRFVDIYKELPPQLELVVGQQLFFFHPDAEGVQMTVTANTPLLKGLPSNKWPRLKSVPDKVVPAISVRRYVVAGFQSTKAGTCDVEITSRVVVPDAPAHTTKLRVIVRPLNPPKQAPSACGRRPQPLKKS